MENGTQMSNNKQQTAVEWLWEIAYNRELTVEDWKQAKEMDKQQKKGMYVEGSFAKMRYYDGLEYIDADQYYNETYGGEQ
jgi:hypothetical protein